VNSSKTILKTELDLDQDSHA